MEIFWDKDGGLGINLAPNNNIQEQTVEIVEDFFLRKNDKDLYTFLRVAIEKPLLEKFSGKTAANPTEAEDMLRSLHSEV